MVFFSLRIFEAAEAPIAWERVDVTPVRYPDGTMGIPKAVIDSVNRNKVGLKSPLMTPGREIKIFLMFQMHDAAEVTETAELAVSVTSAVPG